MNTPENQRASIVALRAVDGTFQRAFTNVNRFLASRVHFTHSRQGGSKVKLNLRAWKIGVLTSITAAALLMNSAFTLTNANAHQMSQNDKSKESNGCLPGDGDRARGIVKETAVGAHKVTLNLTDLRARGFQLSTFVETGSAADLCLATYNTSNQAEVLTPILCTGAEYRGKRGIHLLTNLEARPRDNFEVVVTVYQQDAQYYGAPVPWNIP